MHRYLRVIAGPDRDKVFQISDAFTTQFGRSRHANTQLTDLSVSRVHCEVEIRGKTIYLIDLDSSSGTFVNGKKVSEARLKDGDVVQLGDTQMRVENPTGPEPVSSGSRTIPDANSAKTGAAAEWAV